jgi:hypothetical protein
MEVLIEAQLQATRGHAFKQFFLVQFCDVAQVMIVHRNI